MSVKRWVAKRIKGGYWSQERFGPVKNIEDATLYTSSKRAVSPVNFDIWKPVPVLVTIRPVKGGKKK